MAVRHVIKPAALYAVKQVAIKAVILGVGMVAERYLRRKGLEDQVPTGQEDSAASKEPGRAG